MKKKITLIHALAVALLLCGCCLSHEWAEASCTAPKTCSKCGKTEGEPAEHQWQEATCAVPSTCTECGITHGSTLPHKFGDEEIQNANYVTTTATFVKTCTHCGKQIETERKITQFVDQGVFLMTPVEFSNRFTQALMDMPDLQDYEFSKYFENVPTDLEKIMGGNLYLSYVGDETTSYDLTMYMAKRDRSGKIDIVGEFTMRDSEDHFLSNDQKDASGVLWKIQGKVKGKNSAIVAMLALYRAADPESWQRFLNWMELMADIESSCNVPYVFDTFSAQNTSTVYYDITPKGNSTYEFTITAK